MRAFGVVVGDPGGNFLAGVGRPDKLSRDSQAIGSPCKPLSAASETYGAPTLMPAQ